MDKKFISVKEAAYILKKGGIVALPTETVYGLAGLATNPEAVKKIFLLKMRPFHNPLICHIHDSNLIQEFAYVEDYQKVLFDLWPGPLTILFKKKKTIPDIVTGNSDYCAFRIPDHTIFLEVLKEVNLPLAAPSANPFGKISPINAQMVFEYFQDKIDGIVDGGTCRIGIESTVIKFIDKDKIQILRPGQITKETLEAFGFHVEFIHKTPEILDSPGLLSKHYAPSVPFILFDESYLEEFRLSASPLSLLKKYLNSYLKKISNDTKKIGFLIYGKHFKSHQIHYIYNLSENEDYYEISKNLFFYLSKLEKKCEIIIGFKVKQKGFGIAINDRLIRAADMKINKNTII